MYCTSSSIILTQLTVVKIVIVGVKSFDLKLNIVDSFQPIFYSIGKLNKEIKFDGDREGVRVVVGERVGSLNIRSVFVSGNIKA